MMKTKRLTALALALCLIFTLCACSGGGKLDEAELTGQWVAEAKVPVLGGEDGAATEDCTIKLTLNRNGEGSWETGFTADGTGAKQDFHFSVKGDELHLRYADGEEVYSAEISRNVLTLTGERQTVKFTRSV